jgi:hypothetical protein
VRPNAQKGYWTILFSECTISAIVYLDMMKLYAAPQKSFSMGSSPTERCTATLGGYLFVGSWMQLFQTDGLGGTVQHHGHHVHWTLPLWTFLWGYVKDKVYSTPVPDIDTLKARIRDPLAAVTEEMLEKTWRETEYRQMLSGQVTEHMLKCTNVSQRTF